MTFLVSFPFISLGHGSLHFPHWVGLDLSPPTPVPKFSDFFLTVYIYVCVCVCVCKVLIYMCVYIYIHMYTFFFYILFHYSSSQHVDYSSLCYIVDLAVYPFYM